MTTKTPAKERSKIPVASRYRFILIIAAMFNPMSMAQVNSTQANSTQAFIDKHWQQPVSAAQTSKDQTLPATHDVYPDACGQCHTSQYNDWRNSFHAKAMGPGILGQLAGYSNEQLIAQKCLTCHAPLGLQQKSLESPTGKIHQQGIICAACHVRQNNWFGPGAGIQQGKTGHPQSKSSEAFKASEFCASCHQFSDKSGGISLEGKWLQNTYAEWQDSRFAKQLVSCQSCHMPERRHIWQGIHNKAMVLNGLTIKAERGKNVKGGVNAQLRVTNSGVGHYFPTYVTPRVVLQGFMQDASGNMIENTLQEYEVMRSVSLDLSVEYFDTRLAPAAHIDFDYQQKQPLNAKSLVLRIIVEPDYFYQLFYQQLITQLVEQNPRHKGIKKLRLARLTAQNSPYVLFEQQFSL